MRKDLIEANTKRVKDVIETGRGLKKYTTEGKKAFTWISYYRHLILI